MTTIKTFCEDRPLYLTHKTLLVGKPRYMHNLLPQRIVLEHLLSSSGIVLELPNGYNTVRSRDLLPI